MQTLRLRGRISGKITHLDTETNLPEGAPIEVEIHYAPPPLPYEKRQEILQRLFSMELPVAEWEQMEQEMVRGALGR